MDQALALEVMLSGESVLLTGPAGSGKTHVLNQFIRHAKNSGKTVAVTATTGLAASHLNGTTIHAWSGLGIHDEVGPALVNTLTQARRDTISKTDILVIDEISMLHDFRLDMVDQIARMVREEDSPFGGIQVILCGDFFQLPPVNRSGSREGSFVTGSEVWQQLSPTICYLEEQHRQDDEDFLNILNALRAGDIRRHHAKSLLDRIDTPLSGAVTELHTTNVDVDWINSAQLEAMTGEKHSFKMETVGKTNYVDSLKRSCLAPEELILKAGALVMCIKNSPDHKYVNGSLGTVTGFEMLTGYPVVQLRSGRSLTITPDTWELRDGDKKRASLTQLPLRLAWAITVHKSQGMTLDAARIDLSRAFIEGMGYVALSRVRRLESLSLVGINKMALQVSPLALKLNRRLKEKAELDAVRFAHLAELAKNRQLSPASEGPKDWSGKLTKMRASYPNAFKPWNKDDDQKLQDLFRDGMGVKAMSNEFGRQPGSIRARLKKHFGEDATLLP